MSTLVNPRDLFFLELGELLWIERMLAFEVLPRLVEEIRDEELKQALGKHLEETRLHAAQVERAFRAAGAEPAAARSAGLAGLAEQHDSQELTEPTLRDLFHAGGAARTEHLELALYDSLLGLARELGLGESADVLKENRGEEERALERVSSVAARLRGQLPR